MSRFSFYNPNPNYKDFKNADKTGKHKRCTTCDCTVRAVAKALNVSWFDAYDMLAESGKAVCDAMNSSPSIEHLLTSKGFTRININAKGCGYRGTVDEFAKSHPTGVYVLNVANHEVAVVDGKYYDAFDSGACSLYGYYTKNV